MAAVALDTVLLDEEPTADQVLTAILVLMDFVAYAGAAAMLWINRESLMLHLSLIHISEPTRPY